VRVRIGEQHGRKFVMIEDSGCALTPDVQAHLFTPFFTTKANGQGIGLTLVREILNNYRFDFTLEGGSAVGGRAGRADSIYDLFLSLIDAAGRIFTTATLRCDAHGPSAHTGTTRRR
jgi:hypothetical protein